MKIMNKLIIKCVLGEKIGDSLIRTEDGNLQLIFPDTFYPRNVKAFWQLHKVGYTWEILKFLRAEEQSLYM